MGKPRVGIVAAWIVGGCAILAALIGVFGKGCQPEQPKQSMNVEDSPGSKNTQVTGNYTTQEMKDSPGAIQAGRDYIGKQNNYYGEQAKLGPNLIINLYPEPNKFWSREYLKRDGNSNYYWSDLHEEKFLILPFKIKNVGKAVAVNIKAKYDSPTQSDVWFKVGENSIPPDYETTEFFHIWINVSSLVNDENRREFLISLRITYEGNDGTKSRRYFSLLELKILKINKNSYTIEDSNFNYGEL